MTEIARGRIAGADANDIRWLQPQRQDSDWQQQQQCEYAGTDESLEGLHGGQRHHTPERAASARSGVSMLTSALPKRVANFLEKYFLARLRGVNGRGGRLLELVDSPDCEENHQSNDHEIENSLQEGAVLQ